MIVLVVIGLVLVVWAGECVVEVLAMSDEQTPAASPARSTGASE